MTLLFLRHGQTALNAARVLQPADTPLSALGLKQADAAAARLAGMGLKGILSSDLPRALQTAQAVARATGLHVRTTPLLHERNFGDLRGRPYDHLGFNPMVMEEAPPGGESIAQVQHRADQAFALALAWQRELGGPLLCVSHGLLIRMLLARHSALGAERVAKLAMRNTALAMLSAEPPHQATLFDCTEHLGPGLDESHASLSGA